MIFEENIIKRGKYNKKRLSVKDSLSLKDAVDEI